MEARKFYLDTAARSFVAGLNTTAPASPSVFFAEDVEAIELYFLSPTGSAAAPYRPLNYSANTVKLAVGLTAPAAQQTTWLATSTAITASVSSMLAGTPNNNAVFALNFTGSTPASGQLSVSLDVVEVGGSWVGLSSGVFTSVDPHGFFEGQRIYFFDFTGTTNFTNTGYFARNVSSRSFQISSTRDGSLLSAEATGLGSVYTEPISTGPIGYNELTADRISSALVSAGVVANGRPQVLVSGSVASGFVLELVDQMGNSPKALSVSSTLAAAPGLAANLNFATTEIASLISAGNTSLRMEVEVSDGTRRQTYTTPAQVSSDIIKSSSAAPLPTITPASSFNVTSPDSSVWNITIDNSGNLTATKV